MKPQKKKQKRHRARTDFSEITYGEMADMERLDKSWSMTLAPDMEPSLPLLLNDLSRSTPTLRKLGFTPPIVIDDSFASLAPEELRQRLIVYFDALEAFLLEFRRIRRGVWQIASMQMATIEAVLMLCRDANDVDITVESALRLGVRLGNRQMLSAQFETGDTEKLWRYEMSSFKNSQARRRVAAQKKKKKIWVDYDNSGMTENKFAENYSVDGDCPTLWNGKFLTKRAIQESLRQYGIWLRNRNDFPPVERT